MAVRTQARHEPPLCFDTVEVQFDGPVLLIEYEDPCGELRLRPWGRLALPT